MTTSVFPALSVAVPLLAAGVLAATQSIARKLVGDAIALAAAAATTALCALDLALAVRSGEAVYWFGGWQPRHGVAIGISFTVDPMGAGLATFVGLLTVAAVVFSWRHFGSIGHAFPALLLVFMAAMVGFSLSGDIFNMFVFFELMSVSAIALTGYKASQRASLQGAINFGITNSIGAFLVLTGIALVYGRTGALNLAQIGIALSGHHADGLVLVAFGLIVAGFFVKAAVVPFHFWLADAYATAPTPVCILFAGVMSELGLYAVARIYWTAFSGVLGPHADTLRAILIVAGAVTALLGATMCFLQHHLKRMLAYATISYIGVFLVGIGFLEADGLAGTAIYIVADGLVKASLFICVGIFQHRFSRVDELRLRGMGRALPLTGLVFFAGALALSAMPEWGTFLGKSVIEGAALKTPGYGWVPALFTLAEILTGAAVVRAAGRVFLGWGRPDEADDAADEADRETDSETDGGVGGSSRRTPPVLWLPALVLLLAGLAVGVVPGVEHVAKLAAERFVDRHAYAAAVLHGHVLAVPRPGPSEAPTGADFGYGAASSLGALALGLLALFAHRLPRHPIHEISAGFRAVTGGLRGLHNGHPGDYVAWLTLGAAVFAGVFALTLH